MNGYQFYQRFNKEETKAIKKIVKKYSKNIEIPTNEYIKGSFDIKNVRIYNTRTEADIVFNGQIFARRRSVREWLDNSILTEKGISKIKVNKLIRKYLNSDVMRNLLIFGIETQYYTFKINKVEWV